MTDEFDVVVSEEVATFLRSADEKTERICRNNLSKLSRPYPGRGPGDKEKLVIEGEELYRLHIGRTHTAFYDVLEDENLVQVLDILPIDEAHKRYGH